MIYTITVLPFSMAFIDDDDNDSNPRLIWDSFTLGVFTIDIVLHFFTVTFDSGGQIVYKHKNIAALYLKSWFTIDVLAIFPFQVFTNMTSNYQQLVRLARFPRLIRVLKVVPLIKTFRCFSLSRVSQLTFSIAIKLRINVFLTRIILFTAFFISVTHITACFFHLVARVEAIDGDAWIRLITFKDLEFQS
eukprot:TRINITY_DN10244_c0_g2_i2.p1 TRINITY_DN10244_c0_g2~~TRINITY_DN10244_c0_g2_i2.p1  ORF type:complete len:190 (+),score=14.83 TRINITY_DN10244_c0_g2_i2:82-651(+)